MVNKPQQSSSVEDIYTIEEVSAHSTEEDAWIILNGGVYNITKFIQFHPGGKEILHPNLGTDVTEVFKSDEIHSHSDKAWRLIKQYRIGSVTNSKTKSISSSGSEDDANKWLNLVDMSKPVVNQVLRMENPEIYQQWIHNFPTTVSMRLFESGFFEFFSHYPWWYILPLWVPIIIYNLVWSFINEANYSLMASVIGFCGGVFIWTLIEYFMHRFLFHLETKTPMGNFYHFFAHGIHHLAPLDPTRLTFPPVFSIFIVTFFYKFFLMAESILIPYHSWFAGGLFGYVAYDTMHYFFHHGELCEKVPYMKYMRSHHFKHHYVGVAGNYGVSTAFWDHIFGTVAK